MSLFTLNSDFEVELDKEYLATVKEFSKILRRDRGSKGDSKGLKKQQARREFSFIYNYCDFASPYIEYSDEERFQAAALGAGLPEDFQEAYESDEDLQAAVDVYEKLQETRSLKIIKTAYGVIDKLRIFLDDIDLTKTNAQGNFIHKPKDVMTNLKDLGPMLKKLEELEANVKRELAQSGRLRGGAKQGVEEDPD
jgi:hypothetical protein